MRQLVYVYGDSAPWQDLDRKYSERNDPRIYEDEEQFIRYALNRPQSGKDAWIAKDVVERQARAEVVDWSGLSGHVFLLGERWNATASQPLQAGQRVRVVALDGLTLDVALEVNQPGGTTA